MFEPVKSWSLPAHLYMVSEWSASAPATDSPAELRQRRSSGRTGRPDRPGGRHELATGHDAGRPGLDRPHLPAARPPRQLGATTCRAAPSRTARNDCAPRPAPRCTQNARTPGIWNPLPLFADVQHDHQLQQRPGPVGRSTRAAKDGHAAGGQLDRPVRADSEHPPAQRRTGQAYVTDLINAVMKSPDWNSTAIFLAWDDWGGFYDHVVPPHGRPERLRPPGARAWSSARTPSGATSTTRRSASTPTSSSSRTTSSAARGSIPRPTAAPTRGPTSARTQPVLGNLVADFDFSQPPRAPVLLPTNPPTDSPSIPRVLRRPATVPGLHHCCRRAVSTPAGGTGRTVSTPPGGTGAASYRRGPRIAGRGAGVDHPVGRRCRPARPGRSR